MLPWVTERALLLSSVLLHQSLVCQMTDHKLDNNHDMLSFACPLDLCELPQGCDAWSPCITPCDTHSSFVV